MSTNRLFIYDPETDRAICIAKGYSSGWSTGKGDYVDEWLDGTPEYTGEIEKTRMQLKTEADLPEGATITYEHG